MKNSSDSLEICSKQCGSKCCKSTPPALTKEDIKRIEVQVKQEPWKKTIETEQKTTYVVAKKNQGNNCFFLLEDGSCAIYEQRPLDCRLFPLFVKIKKQMENEFKVKWLVWYCPLTESKGTDVLYSEARELLKKSLKKNPEEIFEYQESMYISGGYKRKHFFKEESLKI